MLSFFRKIKRYFYQHSSRNLNSSIDTTTFLLNAESTGMETAAIKRVKIGKHVDIKRSDGRIHSAMISAICVDSNTVTVEWMENGETKGYILYNYY